MFFYASILCFAQSLLNILLTMSYTFPFKEKKAIFTTGIIGFFDSKIVPVIGMIECHCHHNYLLSHCFFFRKTNWRI